MNQFGFLYETDLIVISADFEIHHEKREDKKATKKELCSKIDKIESQIHELQGTFAIVKNEN